MQFLFLLPNTQLILRSFLSIQSSIQSKSFLSPPHSIILVNSQSITLESGDIVLLFDESGHISYFSIAIGINESEPLHLVVNPLGSKLSQTMNRFEIRGGYPTIRIDMEQIQYRYQ